MIPKHTTKYYDRSELQKIWATWQARTWVGYICLSDRRLENVYTKPIKLPDWDHVHGNQYFILEAYLYDETNKTSLAIKQVNHQWLVSEINWGTDPAQAEGSYLDHQYCIRAEKEYKIQFRTAWQSIQDQQCENMAVLQPTWSAFVGFLNVGEKNES